MYAGIENESHLQFYVARSELNIFSDNIHFVSVFIVNFPCSLPKVVDVNCDLAVIGHFPVSNSNVCNLPMETIRIYIASYVKYISLVYVLFSAYELWPNTYQLAMLHIKGGSPLGK